MGSGWAAGNSARIDASATDGACDFSAFPTGMIRARYKKGGAGGIMQSSKSRILTSHTGSLPRPEALTALYARKSRGEAVDTAALEAAGHAALRWVVGKQIEAGI